MTLHQCHTICRETDNCNWYSYGDKICLIFDTCTSINDANTHYITQHSTCPQLEGSKSTYEERYKTHIETSSTTFAQYLMKEVPGDESHIDCGLYCEEFDSCDFFIQDDNCYLGTFATNLTDQAVVLEERIRGQIYTVFKSGETFRVIFKQCGD